MPRTEPRSARRAVLVRSLLGCALLAVALASPSPAAGQVPPRPQAQDAWARFRADHGPGWRVFWDSGTGFARLVAGGSVSPPGLPAPQDALPALGRGLLRRNRPLFGVDPDHLVLRQVKSLPPAVGKVAVRFAQELQDVPVYRSSLSMLFLPDGRLTAIDNQTVRILPGFDRRPELSASEATETASWAFFDDHGAWPEEASEPALVIFPWTRATGARTPRLAWAIDLGAATAGGDGPPGVRSRYLVAADGGAPAVLDRENLVHSADISGTVRGWATPGLAPDTASNPEALAPLAHLTVQAQGLGSTETDALGAFVFPNALSATTVSAALSGPYCTVENLAGPDATVAASFTPGVPGTLTFNTARTEFPTAEVNAYRWVLAVRDYIKGVDPAITWPDFQALAQVNDTSGVCNAFYFFGSHILFRAAGGGCVNAAYSTVVAHELGHWLNDLTGSFNGSDGFGEGAADAWAVFVTDQPIVGQDFRGPGTIIRTAENLRQFCGDANPGCYGEVHADGEVLMGALWKARRNLEVFRVDGADRADDLFVGWFDAYDQQQIQSVIETQWLTLDDDDGNLANGTPSFAPIDAAFRIQGFPGEEGLAVCYGDVSYGGLMLGTPTRPFARVADCVAPLLPAGEIVLDAGTYPESLTLGKAMTIRASGGVVRIGG